MEAGSEHVKEPKGHDRSASDSESRARWNRITEIVGVAWEMSAEARAAFVAERCGNDESMRAEVESLLGQQQHQSSFLDSAFVGTLSPSTPEVTLGSLLGPYRIEEKIGEGGMGVVFRAFDTRLQRKVAVKVLRRFATEDESARTRFLQEARMAAALNHPHIVTIHDVGSSGDSDFIAMEYVSGSTLDRLIASSHLSLKESLRYAEQIAQALAGAHSLGIVHRDLKPGNVIVGDDGNAKVLDFGLAKRLGEPMDRSAESALPVTQGQTAISSMTLKGTLLGTISYMSPEQARGERVDERSDIFSFGALLFEMISGRKAFSGTNHQEILQAIVHCTAPRLRSIRPATPYILDGIVSRCLNKCPERRPQTADLLDVLKKLQSGHRIKGGIAAVVLSLLFAIIGVTIWALTRRPSVVEPLQSLATPITSYPGEQIAPTFSPDGTRVVFAWRHDPDSNFDLYEQPITGGKPERLTTSPTNDFSPAWSPDGRVIAFFRQEQSESNSIMLIPASGGAERKLISTHGRTWLYSRGLAWSPDNGWLAFPDVDRPTPLFCIFAVSTRSGEVRRITVPAVGEAHLQPAFSENGRMLAFTADRDGLSQVGLLRLKPAMTPDGASWTLHLAGFESAICNSPIWRPNGHDLMFLSSKGGPGGNLWSVDVSDSERKTPTPRLIGSLGSSANLPALSPRGDRLAFTRRVIDNNIWRVSLSGEVAPGAIELIASTQQEGFPQYSPDGRRIAFESDRSGFPEIWITNADGSDAFAVTEFRGPVTGSPSWSPDSQQIAFDTRVTGQPEIFLVRAERGARPQQVTFGGGTNILPSWSSDGRFIYFNSDRTGEDRIWKTPTSGGPVEPITSRSAFCPELSPDGRFLYFMIWRSDHGEIHRLSLENQEEQLVARDARDRSFSVTSGGVYYLQQVKGQSARLRFWDADKRRDLVVATLQGPITMGLSVSPDRRYALFVRSDESSSDMMLLEHFLR
jgi:eukaryotic-like serine/threonine-protein kinase